MALILCSSAHLKTVLPPLRLVIVHHYSTAKARTLLRVTSPRCSLQLPENADTLLSYIISAESDPHRKVLLSSVKGMLRQAEKTEQLREQLLAEKEKTINYLTYECLKLKGLNDTRGLLEYIQGKLLQKHAIAMKPGLAAWREILEKEPQLVTCLRKEWKNSTTDQLAAHMTATYTLLSNNIHAGNRLDYVQGSITFRSDFLAPEQGCAISCAAQAINITAKPDNTGFIS